MKKNKAQNRVMTAVRDMFLAGKSLESAISLLEPTGIRRSEIHRQYAILRKIDRAAEGPIIGYGQQAPIRRAPLMRGDHRMVMALCGVSRGGSYILDDPDGHCQDWPREWSAIAAMLEPDSPDKKHLDEKVLNAVRRSIPGGTWSYETERTS